MKMEYLCSVHEIDDIESTDSQQTVNSFFWSNDEHLKFYEDMFNDYGTETSHQYQLLEIAIYIYIYI